MSTRKSNWLQSRGDRPYNEELRTSPGHKRPPRPTLSSQTPRRARESHRLYLDNLKLWDCLALVRSDVSMSCQSAINLIFSLSNTDYLRAFPDSLQSINARFPGGVVRYDSLEEADEEDMRLREENIRLHAAVWVLRDNPGLHADSALAAIFRLSQEQFKDKFPFNYESDGVHNLRSSVAMRTHTTTERTETTVPMSNDRKENDDGSVDGHREEIVGRRCRSSSEKRNKDSKSQPHHLAPHRRSSSTWGREDFTSNWSPSSSPPRHPNMPDPPMTITQGVKSRLKAAHVTRLSKSGRNYQSKNGANDNRSCSNLDSIPKMASKRSPSAMGRIEGQPRDCVSGEDEESNWTEAMEEIEKCSAKLGLEVNGPHKNQNHGWRPTVTFAEPLEDKNKKKRHFLPIHPSLDNLNFIEKGPRHFMDQQRQFQCNTKM